MDLEEKPRSYLSLAETGKNQWWRYLLGISVVICASQIIGLIPGLLYTELADQGNLSIEEFEFYKSDMDFEALGLSRNIGLVTLILSFAIGIAGLYFVIRFIHNRPFRLLINGYNKIRWNRIIFSVLVWGGIGIIHFLVGVFIFDDPVYLQFEWATFLPLLFICIFFLPLQTSFEELVFRGYYLQGISLLTKYPIIPVIVTSILFVIVHMFNPEVSAFGWDVMITYYFTFAFAMAVVTIMDDGLELALGMHAIHNITSALTVTYEDAVIQTDAIWIADEVHFDWASIGMHVISLILFVYLCYRRFYKPQSASHNSRAESEKDRNLKDLC